MSRLTIDISPEQHKSLKAMAALEGKTIRQYALERLFPARRRAASSSGLTAADAEAELVSGVWTEPAPDPAAPPLPPGHRPIFLGELIDKDEAQMDEEEKAAWAHFCAFIEERAAEARAGKLSDKSFDEIVEDALQDERRNETA